MFQRTHRRERDVFEGNSPAERAELAASDPDNDVFDGNTLSVCGVAGVLSDCGVDTSGCTVVSGVFDWNTSSPVGSLPV